jgi:adenylyltransferase/sulfurtransferase
VRAGSREADVRADRFSRQIAYGKIGQAGQERLIGARAAIIGIGALGTVIAQSLCRSGIGFLRLVDRDYVEESNLQRQVLFDEADARDGLPKAAAAAAHLRAIDSNVVVDPVVADLSPANVERIVGDVDVVLDGTDNFQARYLVNEACHKHGIPWVYGGALQDFGATMNILPGKGPCLRCLLRDAPIPGSFPTCATAGILNMATGVIGSIEAAEALKILLGSGEVRKTYLTLSLWDFSVQELKLERDPGCPTCGEGRYELLGASSDAYAVSLCGRDSVQVSPAAGTNVNFEALAARLRSLGSVKISEFMLTFVSPEREFRLFRDGRAIISKVRDAGAAKSVYAEFIGL